MEKEFLVPIELAGDALALVSGGHGSQLDPDGATAPRGGMIDPNGAP